MDILNMSMSVSGVAPTEALNISQEDYTNVTNITFSPYYQHSLFVAAIYILAYFFIFLLCMVGNTLVCCIVLENRRMRTVINLFIFNLAVSDLLVGIFCIPTTLVDNLITGWPFSKAVCKMSGFVQGVSVSASVFTLVAIAVERFRCIVYPLRPKPTVLVAKTAVALIWALAVLIMSPAAMVLTVEQVPFHYMVHNEDFNNTMPLYTCYEDFANPRMRKVYTVVLFVHIYLAPLAIIAFMYGSIGVKLFNSVLANREAQVPNGTVQAGVRRGRQPVISQKKIMVIKMLILVTLVFMLSWLPLWILMMMADYAGLDREQLDLLTSYIFPFAHWLAFSNSSVNPIIYGYYNENLQRGLQAVCRSKPFCCLMHCQLWSRMTRWSRKHRSVQAPCRAEDNTNRNHPVLGVRNRVHNTDKFIDTARRNGASRVSCVVVHSERGISDQGVEMAVIQKNSSNDQEPERASCLAASVHNAWEN